MIIYLIKSMIGMLICLILYYRLLAKNKSFHFNRFFLITGLIGACIAPLITVPFFVIKDSSAPILEFISLESANSPIASHIDAGEAIKTTTYAPFDLLSILYFVICTVVALRLFFHIIKMLWSAHVSCRENRSGMKIAVINSKKTPFSFFNTLFIDKKTFEKGIPKEIIDHERCHARQLHSIDRLIIEFTILIHWWNPAIYFLKKAIVENHEYLADNYALKRDNNKVDYITKILKYSTPSMSQFCISNSFAHSSINKRIKMIANDSTLAPTTTLIITCTILLLTFVACTDITEAEIPLGFTEDELSVVYSDNNEMKAVYPAVLLQQAQELGMNIPLGIVPEYRSPSPELFKKLRTEDKFTIKMDNNEVDRNALAQYQRKSIKRFRIRGKGIQPVEEEQFSAELFTHSGYIRQFEQGLQFVQDMADRQNIILSIPESRKPEDNPLTLPKMKRPSPILFANLASPNGMLLKIDGKQVDRKILENMSPEDFGYYTRIGWEINLLTNERFEKFREEITERLDSK